ncbi:hypothetical protein VTL71DRAFT_4458 [Oculimacula yallundae]|uniref:Uncharacterized protein n=1 Tax=Oculimacula yallundae TaxID=86028 RepID=A0ABR4C3Q5_9HELO
MNNQTSAVEPKREPKKSEFEAEPKKMKFQLEKEALPSPWIPHLFEKQAGVVFRIVMAAFKTLLCQALFYTIYYAFLLLITFILVAFVSLAAKRAACATPFLKQKTPFCTVTTTTSSNFEFGKLGNLQIMLEEIQEASSRGLTTPLQMKRGENAIREVAVNVELSNLPSKNEIGKQLREYQQRARIAGDDLRTLNSHLDRTMDSIILTNEWTAHTLVAIACEVETDGSKGTTAEFLSKGVAFFDGRKPSTEEAVKLHYIRHLSQVKDDIDILIVETGLSVINLRELESLLFSVEIIGKQDKMEISKAKVKASKKLAAIFELNWEEMEGLEEQGTVVLELLQQKDVALARVVGMLEHLKAVSAGLGDLRERVYLPGRPQEKEVPLLIQIETIHRGLERLQLGRDRTRQRKHQYLEEIRDQIS